MKSWGIPFGGDERDLVGFAVVSHYSAYIFNISMHIIYIYMMLRVSASAPRYVADNPSGAICDIAAGTAAADRLELCQHRAG